MDDDQLRPVASLFSPQMTVMFGTFMDAIRTAAVTACDCEACILLRAFGGAMDDAVRSDG